MSEVKVWNKPGINNVGSYQVSGLPYVTGSVLSSGSYSTNNGQVQVSFPYVTRSITVISRSDTNIRVHFNDLTSGNVISARHYITLTAEKDTITFNVKAKEIYVSLEDNISDGEFELFAELTTISSREMYDLTGSGLTS